VHHKESVSLGTQQTAFAISSIDISLGAFFDDHAMDDALKSDKGAVSGPREPYFFLGTLKMPDEQDK
jgi:hypothetical protein